MVAPASLDAQIDVFEDYAPLWALLTPDAREKIAKGNYERLFDRAGAKVRAWEAANVK